MYVCTFTSTYSLTFFIIEYEKLPISTVDFFYDGMRECAGAMTMPIGKSATVHTYLYTQVYIFYCDFIEHCQWKIFLTVLH